MNFGKNRKLVVGIVFGLLASTSTTQAEDFKTILTDHWETALKEQVFFRRDPDGWRPDGKLASVSKTARDRRHAFNETILARLKTVDVDTLNAQDRVSYKVFKFERETERESYGFQDHLFPMDKLSGYHTYFAEAPSAMAFSTKADYDKYLVSLVDFPRYNDEHIANMREGIDKGYTQACESIRGYEKTISIHVVSNPQNSLLFVPFKAFPANMSDADKSSILTKGKDLIMSSVVPEYKKLHDFYVNDYVPNCRKKVGINSLPGGSDFYSYRLRYYTTTNLSAKAIHDMGRQEVKRIKAEMETIIQKVGFKGDFKAFLDFMRSDKRFYATSKQDLLEKAAWITKQIDGELPKLFKTLPRNTFKIKANEGRGTFYMPASPGGKTSGTYFVGTGDWQTSPLYNLTSLSLHEGSPGHHVQSALAMELDLPKFQQTLYHSAFGEGWGLYSERLGLEMGLYEDPYTDFGRLTYEMWRAGRLVVDTGLHAVSWSRQRAIDYLLSISALSVAGVTSEVDRYITWPGQAVSYKIGELQISTMRKKAEKAMGNAFDVREFHEVVLKNGSLPLAVLAEVVDEWITTYK